MSKTDVIDLNKWHRLEGEADNREVYLDGKWLDPRPGQKIMNHSPDGYNWGYSGSGPAQLALAIMLRLTGQADGYQQLKDRVVAKLPQGHSFVARFTLAGEVKWETTGNAEEDEQEKL